MDWGSLEQAPTEYAGYAGNAPQSASPHVPNVQGGTSPVPTGFSGPLGQDEGAEAVEGGVAKTGFWDKVTSAFAPGTPGAQILESGTQAAASWIQQSRSSLASLQAQLARKQQALKGAKAAGKRARLQTEIQLLMQQIAQLEGALASQGVQLPAKKKVPWWGFGLGGLGIIGLLGGVVYMLWGRK